MTEEHQPGYKTIEEIRTIVAEGLSFRQNLTKELGIYLRETTAITSVAEEFLGRAEYNQFSKPEAEVVTVMLAEVEASERDEAMVQAALGALSMPKSTADPSLHENLLTKVTRARELLEQYPSQTS